MNTSKLSISTLLYINALALVSCAQGTAGVAHKQSVLNLYCNGKSHFWTDLAEDVSVRKAVLSGDRFTIWVGHGMHSRMYSKKVSPLADGNGAGFQLDGESLVGLRPVSKETYLVTELTFFRLGGGPHHLKLGVMNSSGVLAYANDLCFTSPGAEVWQW